MKIYAVFKLIRLKTILWVSVGSGYGFATVLLGHLPDPTFNYFVICTALCHATAIIWNDISDIEIDRLSTEVLKRERPLVTGQISVKEAHLIAIIFYVTALLVAFTYSEFLLLFVFGIGFMCHSYSFKPLYFSGHTYSSILYWIISGIMAYIFIVFYLSNAQIKDLLDINYILKNTMLWSWKGIIFIISTILYIGIGYILSKDLRDIDNDLAGGKKTFANTKNLKDTLNILLYLSLIGILLWNVIFILEGVFFNNIFPLCFFLLSLGSMYEIYQSSKTMYSKGFDKGLSIQLSVNWMNNYLLMQLFTILAFSK